MALPGGLSEEGSGCRVVGTKGSVCRSGGRVLLGWSPAGCSLWRAMKPMPADARPVNARPRPLKPQPQAAATMAAKPRTRMITAPGLRSESGVCGIDNV
ncbi:MAG: hypothetical protein QM749_18140 [Aquabacterium sp.]